MARHTRGTQAATTRTETARTANARTAAGRATSQQPRRSPSRRPAPRHRRRGLSGVLMRVGALVVAVILVLAVLRIAGCDILGHGSLAESVTTGVDTSKLYQSPYDWSNLSQDASGRYTYASGGQTLSRTGIDVSEHQGYIDWTKVKNDGIDFAIIRVGYRGSDNASIVKDNYAEYNLKTAQAAGLDIGVYFYSQATTTDEAVEEADFVLNQIGSAQLTYPIVFDFEPTGDGSDRISSLSGTQRTEIALAFCKRIEQAGHAAMVYGNGTQLEGYDLEQLAPYGFWYAEYGSTPSTNLYFGIWQYSNTGTVAGVDTNVDLDLDLTPVGTQSEAQ